MLAVMSYWMMGVGKNILLCFSSFDLQRACVNALSLEGASMGRQPEGPGWEKVQLTSPAWDRIRGPDKDRESPEAEGPGGCAGRIFCVTPSLVRMVMVRRVFSVYILLYGSWCFHICHCI